MDETMGVWMTLD